MMIFSLFALESASQRIMLFEINVQSASQRIMLFEIEE